MVNNYMFWSVIDQLGDNFPEAPYSTAYPVNSVATTHCFESTDKYFPFAVGAIYLEGASVKERFAEVSPFLVHMWN